MSVLGIGVDVVRVSRILRLLENTKKGRFIQRVLHPSEVKNFHNHDNETVARYVAGCWAAKEAVFKTLDPKDQKKFQFKRWYRYSEAGRPYIGFDEKMADEFLLSISHDGDILVATVLRQKKLGSDGH